MSFKVGDEVGDYEVTGVLGAGGMGQVYKVRNVLSNRLEAMKVVLPGTLGTGDQAERFLREIRVQASLDHPNIAALRTALRINNELVMVMELVEGKTLHDMIERGPLSMKDSINYMSQALSALAYAHERGVIHRDIKPANIMLTEDGIIKLTDFGIAKAAVDRSLTAVGATMGSIYYMSPEQVSGSSALDGRSDLYSLGVTLYQAVTGSLPFQESTDYAILSAHLNSPPTPPQEKNPRVPPELSQVILKALAKDPAARFQTANEFREALQKVGGLPAEGTSTKPIAIPDGVIMTPPVSPSQAGTTRPTGTKSATPGSATLETANVLFMDIVAYSKLPMDKQTERISQLVDIVRDTDEYRRAHESDQVISLPTGDGMALVFFQNPIAAVQCATEVSRVLRTHPEMKLRMGVHSGPVYRIPDINTNRNVAGGGINMAQRVMDCGDAGHILVSQTVAETLGQLSSWADHLHDLGDAEVKHGVKVHIVNFYTDEVGNPELPQKLRMAMAAQTAPPLPALNPSPFPNAVPAIIAANSSVSQSSGVSPVASQIPPPISRPITVPSSAPASRSNGLVIAAVVVVVLVVLGFGANQFLHKNSSKQDFNSPTPAAQNPSQPSAPVPPPPPGGTTASVPPSGPPPGITPPQTPPPSAPQSQAAVAPAPKTAAALRPAPTAQAAPVAQGRPEAPPQQAAASAASGAAAAQASADKAQLQEQRERMMLLAGRVAALRGSLDNLQRQQSASGLGLRGDMAAAKGSMEYLMGEAKSSLTAGDSAGSKRSMDMAEQQIEKLEHFLGR